MLRLTHRLDGMPILLRALTAYTALAAVTLAILSVASQDWRHTAYAVALAVDVGLLCWRDRRAWWLQVVVCTAILIGSVVQQGVLVVAETMTLAVLAFPSSRAYYDSQDTVAA